MLNVLVIIADQLAQQGVGVYGDPLGVTPNIDALARRGVRFANVYSTFPLCGPARASLWTSRLPHETGVVSNNGEYPCGPVPATMPTLGDRMTEAGYRCVHFGKTHDSGSLRGFEVVKEESVEIPSPPGFPYNHDTFRDIATTRQAVAFFRDGGAGEGDAPFLAVVDLNNPHNICGWVGEHAGASAPVTVPGPLPPAPANFEPADMSRRPRSVQYICCAHRRQSQAAQWDEQQFRAYRAAYAHYTRLMDAQVGEILAALETSGQASKTLVLFMADHGDGMGCHRMATKHTNFYEPSTRIPLIAAGAGVAVSEDDQATGGRVIEAPLASLLDIVPTICDAAGAPAPAGMFRGRSLAPWLSSRSSDGDAGGGAYPATPCDQDIPSRLTDAPEQLGMTVPGDEPALPFVVSQWHTEWGYTIEPGRMLRTARYKYCRYAEGGEEEFYDLLADPLEMRTLVDEPSHREALEAHRRLLEAYCAHADDPFLSQRAKVDPQWRSHEPGFCHHDGLSAPEASGRWAKV